MRTMFDAVTVADIPADATMVAGYVDGRYANLPEMRIRFPRALVVSVTVAGGDADVLDVENGDASPAQAPGWIAAHPSGSLYCNASTLPAVRAAFGDRPLPPIWLADYDGDPTIPACAVAKQYASNDYYDTSSAADYWPGVDPAPTPVEDNMPLTAADAQLVVHTLLESALPDVGQTNPDGSPATRTIAQWFEYLDAHYLALHAQNTALAAQVTALSAALTADHGPAPAVGS